MQGELRVYSDPVTLARALAALFIETARASIARHGSFSVALAGGSTPKAAYELLAVPPLSMSLDWSKVSIFFGDERCVPPADDRSNFKTANDAFISAVGIPAANVHRMRGEDDPTVAAAAYRFELTQALGERPRFDLTMLGMGPDGHTASLFPGEDPLTDDDRLVRAVYSSSQTQWRITLTPRVLNASRLVVFAVEGSAKAAMLEQVRTGPRNPTQFPAQIIAPTSGDLIWLLDAAAANG